MAQLNPPSRIDQDRSHRLRIEFIESPPQSQSDPKNDRGDRKGDRTKSLGRDRRSGGNLNKYHQHANKAVNFVNRLKRKFELEEIVTS